MKLSKKMVNQMKKGSVIVDVAIDQSGLTNLTKNEPTTHALSNAPTRYAKAISKLGVVKIRNRFPELIGVITYIKAN